MKDWQRSPEPPGMMGPGPSTSAHDGLPAASSAHPDPSSSSGPLPSSSASAGPSRTQPRKVDLTLSEMCKRTIIRRLNDYESFGNLPFRVLRPILERATPRQLFSLEQESPHLIEEADYIWKKICLAEFPEVRRSLLQEGGSGADEPPTTTTTTTEPMAEKGDTGKKRKWRDVYVDTLGKKEEVKRQAAKRLKERYGQQREDKERSKVQVVSTPRLSAGRGTRKRGGGTSGGTGATTTGQKLLNKARAQGQARSKLTLSSGPSSSSSSSSSPASLPKRRF